MKRSFLYIAVAATFCASLFLSLRAVQAQGTNPNPNGDSFPSAPMFPGVTNGAAAPPMLKGATNGVIGPPGLAVTTPSIPTTLRDAPVDLRGASCGTIGPQSGPDASVITGVNTLGIPRPIERKPQSFAVFLINIIAASVIIFALSRKISHMWVLATVVATVTAVSGFACALVSGI